MKNFITHYYCEPRIEKLKIKIFKYMIHSICKNAVVPKYIFQEIFHFESFWLIGLTAIFLKILNYNLQKGKRLKNMVR